DAAHVHYPVGGQGLNTGVLDAVNLGWKLAQVVNGTSSDSLLDTYHAERHPVAARVLRNTIAQTLLINPNDYVKTLGDIITELLNMEEPRRRFAAMVSGLGIRYDLGEGHPLLGRRMPDLDLVTENGPLRVFTCCTTPGRCYSTSVSPAASTSLTPPQSLPGAGRRSVTRILGFSAQSRGPAQLGRDRRGQGTRGAGDPPPGLLARVMPPYNLAMARADCSLPARPAGSRSVAGDIDLGGPAPAAAALLDPSVADHRHLLQER